MGESQRKRGTKYDEAADDTSSQRQRTYLQDPVHDADDEGGDEDKEDEDGEDDGIESGKKQEADSSSSKEPFRFSPSGRRRSDYEVQRLERIQRNEQKLDQLGLLQQSSDTNINSESTLTKKKRGRKRKSPAPALLPDDISSPKNKRALLPPQRSHPKRSKQATSLQRFSPSFLGGGLEGEPSVS